MIQDLGRLAVATGTVLTVGVFDGVHLGHQHLLMHLKEEAQRQGLVGGVVTFHPHPRLLLGNSTSIPYLISLEDRVRLLEELGIGLVVVLAFTSNLADLPAQTFMEYLIDALRMRTLVVGSDFALGRNREGNVPFLQALGQKKDFSVRVIPPLVLEGEVVSSSVIRQALAQGDVDKAARFLGRKVRVSGPVVHGAQRGRHISFPTANVGVPPGLVLPADGVYATQAWVDGVAYPSVTNIGKRPTFDYGERSVEVYLLDFQQDLYGRELAVDVLRRLRDERRFASVEELQRQIAQDVMEARALFGAQKVS